MLLCDGWRPWKEKQSWPTRINKVTWTLTVGNEGFNFLCCFQIKLLCEVWRAKYAASTATLRIAASLPLILQKNLFYPDLRTVSLCKSGWLCLLHTSSCFARISFESSAGTTRTELDLLVLFDITASHFLQTSLWSAARKNASGCVCAVTKSPTLTQSM